MLVNAEKALGIATYRFPRELRAALPTLDWAGIAGLRDHLVHNYGHVDRDVLAQVLRQDLPALVQEIRRADAS